MPTTHFCPHCRTSDPRSSPAGEFVARRGNQPELRVRVVRLTCPSCGYAEEWAAESEQQTKPELELTPVSHQKRGS